MRNREGRERKGVSGEIPVSRYLLARWGWGLADRRSRWGGRRRRAAQQPKRRASYFFFLFFLFFSFLSVFFVIGEYAELFSFLKKKNQTPPSQVETILFEKKTWSN